MMISPTKEAAARSDYSQRFMDVVVELSFGDSYCAGREDTPGRISSQNRSNFFSRQS